MKKLLFLLLTCSIVSQVFSMEERESYERQALKKKFEINSDYQRLYDEYNDLEQNKDYYLQQYQQDGMTLSNANAKYYDKLDKLRKQIQFYNRVFPTEYSWE